MSILRGATQAGPTLAILGGVHGDEEEGVLAVRQLLTRLADIDFVGVVKAVAPANAIAWSACSRRNPLDGGDLARSFPGHGSSGPTAAIATAITEKVIKGADLLIDLHSAGLRYCMPLFCGYIDTPDAAKACHRAAIAFGTPLVWKHDKTPEGRSITIAASSGIPAIYAECGGGGAIKRDHLDAYVTGVLSVMADLEMLPSSYRYSNSTTPQYVISGQGDLDQATKATHSGFFVASTEAGSFVKHGDKIGQIFDYNGDLVEEFYAPTDEVIMFLRRQARIQAGETVYSSGLATSRGNDTDPI
ncbi:putative deacylase [Amycolatopsis bartoniae]|nr:M14 family metallopeptidase [Amycolatopsis bartoniae]MBB2933557.1 putative deacylase [Amycolatopsis bartoniae]TVT10737.1 hypothetical protein FNH07_03815 [Amycolatopsis bartoniae]